MRRSIFAIVMVGAVVGAAASAASAKGFEHSRVTITGPGLDAPIVLSGDQAVLYLAGSGISQPKWSVPNIGGTLRDPDADLGPAYTAVVSIGCERGKRSVFRETLYPSAPLGLQVFTPEGAVWCFGQEVKAGYWPASDDLLGALVGAGVPSNPTDTAQVASAPQRRTVATSAGPSSWWWIAVLLLLLAILGAAGFVATARRRARS